MMLHDVRRVEVLEAHRLRLGFDDGSEGDVDRYGEWRATVAIDSLSILSGELPPRVVGLVAEWATLHRDELRDDWERARQGLPLEKIAPLE